VSNVKNRIVGLKHLQPFESRTKIIRADLRNQVARIARKHQEQVDKGIYKQNDQDGTEFNSGASSPDPTEHKEQE